ncbi:helix-turn-helix transcriptional regulator [Aquincola sp. S2]|uniref:Helix-turn-helix transcriptional regulator n=1 Tax=Pseudaquabacterium terrae TaxID=2732868 RepID=A0ABX2EMT7_9BURK|nr:LuxR C-terminal-related transcriptional regulator [Aquabacterium terrae]NRF69804.1 helix-turn-helix transcriptional regulator [Aquabacterium terrae]
MTTSSPDRVAALPRALPDWLDPAADFDRPPPILDAPRDGLAPVLDQIDYGLVLLGAGLEVLHANAAARATFADGHPLLLRHEVLIAGSDDTVVLAQAVRDAIRRAKRSCLALQHEGRRAVVAIVPVELARGRAALLLMERRSVCAPLSIQCFSSAHGLTPTESRLLALLCDGSTPAQMARIQGVAVSTIRTQTASLRAKTGATSLRDLLRRVAALPPMLPLQLQWLAN